MSRTHTHTHTSGHFAFFPFSAETFIFDFPSPPFVFFYRKKVETTNRLEAYRMSDGRWDVQCAANGKVWFLGARWLDQLLYIYIFRGELWDLGPDSGGIYSFAPFFSPAPWRHIKQMELFRLRPSLKRKKERERQWVGPTAMLEGERPNIFLSGLSSGSTSHTSQHFDQ